MYAWHKTGNYMHVLQFTLKAPTQKKYILACCFRQATISNTITPSHPYMYTSWDCMMSVGFLGSVYTCLLLIDKTSDSRDLTQMLYGIYFFSRYMLWYVKILYKFSLIHILHTILLFNIICYFGYHFLGKEGSR